MMGASKDMENVDLRGKKLLILGANAETVPLVKVAKEMGVVTIVTSSIKNDAAKNVADISYDVDGVDVSGLIELARKESIDGVLVGVADVLVPIYCKVCSALDLPCYATDEIVKIFSYKDRFKACCEKYGIHGIPEFYLDEKMDREDLDKLVYPVVVKPVDSRSGIGITVCYEETEIESAVREALAHSRCKRFIVEKYMQCDDMGIYYTFKDGNCSASCVYDRYTTGKQIGKSRVCLGGTYPSKHIDEYFSRMHDNACRMFKNIDIQNGVLMFSAFYMNGEFYVYDTGFRLQGEAPHILMKAIHGFDQREMLIRFALTGSEGNIDLLSEDDAYLRGKWASTYWVLASKGNIAEIKGLENIDNDRRVVANIQRLHEGDSIQESWIGTEKQVITRLYFVCDSKEELADTIEEYKNKISVFDSNGNEMMVDTLDVDEALGIK